MDRADGQCIVSLSMRIHKDISSRAVQCMTIFASGSRGED